MPEEKEMGTVLDEAAADNLWRRAVHEAGHAVFAYHLCIPIREVWIVPDEGGGGGGVAHKGPTAPSGAARRVYTAFLYAGMVAEQTFLGVSGLRSGTDLRTIEELYGYDCDATGKKGDEDLEDAVEVLDAIRPLVLEVFTRREAAVRRLVRALFEKNRLTGTEVARIIHRHRHRRDHSRIPQSVWVHLE